MESSWLICNPGFHQLRGAGVERVEQTQGNIDHVHSEDSQLNLVSGKTIVF